MLIWLQTPVSRRKQSRIETEEEDEEEDEEEEDEDDEEELDELEIKELPDFGWFTSSIESFIANRRDDICLHELRPHRLLFPHRFWG